MGRVVVFGARPRPVAARQGVPLVDLLAAGAAGSAVLLWTLALHLLAG